MYILGLNAFHGDSSACLLWDGEIVGAAEEERFRRVKHWAGVPMQAIEYCLELAGVGIQQVDHIAINADPRAHFGKKLRYSLGGTAGSQLIREKLANRGRRRDITALLEHGFDLDIGSLKVQRIEHHLCHLSSAYYGSSFEESTVVSVDGFGDFSSGAWGRGSSEGIRVDGYVHFPHSLGIFYQAMTQFLGFPNYGDEYKVMGLAPYGEPKYRREMDEILQNGQDGIYHLELKYFRHHREPIGFDWANCAPRVGRLFSSALEELLGEARNEKIPITQRHKDLARSVQDAYQRAFFVFLNAIHRRHGSTNLALAGGCAMNSVANGKILENTPFENIYIQPAGGDAGGAVGAALELWRRLSGNALTNAMPHAYWGPEFSDDHVKRLLAREAERLPASLFRHICFDSDAELCVNTARLLAEGNVVGWFQGRMEWGPRALGNRSILADPRRADMKDILNRKIKRRESFRPFAPSVLRERAGEWFEVDDDVPFMMKVYPVRVERRTQIPAVTHVDGSGRLQTVTPESNSLYYGLISEFEKLTSVPMLLNTSFNENEPIVCRPEEALECFLRTNMDILVLGRRMLRRIVREEGESWTK